MDIAQALNDLRKLGFVVENDGKVKSESWFYEGGNFTKFTIIVREENNITAQSVKFA